MRLKNRIVFRLTHWVEQQKRKQMLASASMANFPPHLPLELFNLCQSIQADLGKHAITHLVDIGAHKGLFSRSFSHFFDLKKVYCFEPNESLHPTIRSNTSHLDAEYISVALGSRSGMMPYFLHEDSAMNSLVEAKTEVLQAHFPYDDPDQIREAEVEVATLDEVFQAHTIPLEKALIKVDTQGNELGILQGGTAVLSKVKACLIEHMFIDAYMSSYSFEDLVKFMDGLGFKCRGSLSISKRSNGAISSVDFFFVRP